MLWFNCSLLLLVNFGIIQKHYKDLKNKTEGNYFFYVFNYPLKFSLILRLFFWFIMPAFVMFFSATFITEVWGAYYWLMPTKDVGFFYKHFILEMETLGLSEPLPADIGNWMAGLWAALKQLYAFSLTSSFLIVVFFQKWHKRSLNQAQR